MYPKSCLFAAVGAVALAMSVASVQAAPLSGAAQNTTAGDSTLVQEAAWVRQCWRHRGHLHCQRDWRDDGYYYGPGVGFFFGGGGHRHHHHYRHHRH